MRASVAAVEAGCGLAPVRAAGPALAAATGGRRSKRALVSQERAGATLAQAPLMRIECVARLKQEPAVPKGPPRLPYFLDAGGV